MAYSSCCEKSIVDEEADSIALAPLLFVVINTRREQKQCRRLNMALQLSHHYYTQFTSIQIHWRLNIHRGITNTIQYTQAGHFRRATKHNALQSLSGRTGPTSIDLAADHLLQTTQWYKKRITLLPSDQTQWTSQQSLSGRRDIILLLPAGTRISKRSASYFWLAVLLAVRMRLRWVSFATLFLFLTLSAGVVTGFLTLTLLGVGMPAGLLARALGVEGMGWGNWRARRGAGELCC